MTLNTDLTAYVKETFRAAWEERNGRDVPEPKDVALGNVAVNFDRATVIYADLSGSTNLVDTKQWWFAAEVYKNFLYCAARIITDNSGVITAYDGDRIMGVFVGDKQSPNAARCALKINYATKNIINPAIKEKHPTLDFQVKHVVGIDSSQIRVAKTGVRGDTDLVWVGRAANYAAKLTEQPEAYATWITKSVFSNLDQSTWYGGEPQKIMWSKTSWDKMANLEIYCSDWTWAI